MESYREIFVIVTPPEGFTRKVGKQLHLFAEPDGIRFAQVLVEEAHFQNHIKSLEHVTIRSENIPQGLVCHVKWRSLSPSKKITIGNKIVDTLPKQHIKPNFNLLPQWVKDLLGG
ncbi:MAG TPA: hypothetical protein VLG12_04030 [Candidatus Saccharimonadales bacterium]|nr:hypothetical protein [Candidatus Saccharimonadales bacterium]